MKLLIWTNYNQHFFQIVSQFVRKTRSQVTKSLVSKPGKFYELDSLKIKSHYIIKCLVVLPNSLLSVPRMST